MASFEDILDRPASENKPPEALPVGTYHCLVEGQPEHGKSSQKQTDYFRFRLRIIEPCEDVDQFVAAEQQVKGKYISHDIYVTEASSWRLNEFLIDHLGIELMDGSRTKKTRELIAESQGKQVRVTLKHEASPDGKRVFHRVATTGRA